MATSQRSSAVHFIKRPFVQFVQLKAKEGILLLACTVVALAWANSPWASSYVRLWHTPMTLGIGALSLSKSLEHWINDGLMAVFFFVVGLEIKRETLVGELASLRKAALPVVAAIGGMIVPAGIYALLNVRGEGASGWGIPMATDIAFAIGVLTMLGKRVPISLKVFLTALAIVDDIGAVLVIAFFYTSHLYLVSLLIAAAILLALIFVNAAGVRRAWIYLLLGIGLWLGFLEGGIHATLAGVVLAMTIPASSRIKPGQLTQEASHETLLGRMEARLHPWVAYLIMPLFALANAGVPLGSGLTSWLMHPVGLGVILGLVVGKPVGIMLFSGGAILLRWADRPRHASWRQMWGAGCLAGIGFTMSLFIANLALGAELLAVAKLAILLASLIAGVLGWLLLRSTRILAEPH